MHVQAALHVHMHVHVGDTFEDTDCMCITIVTVYVCMGDSTVARLIVTDTRCMVLI